MILFRLPGTGLFGPEIVHSIAGIPADVTVTSASTRASNTPMPTGNDRIFTLLATTTLHEPYVRFTRRRQHGIVTVTARLRYGAILWDASADLDDAIRLVKAVADPLDAIRLVTVCCQGANAGRWWTCE
jgi:hypothetical protein